MTARMQGQRQPHVLTQQPTCGRMHSWQGGGGDFNHGLVESEVKVEAEVKVEEEESEVKAETMKEAEVKAERLGVKA